MYLNNNDSKILVTGRRVVTEVTTKLPFYSVISNLLNAESQYNRTCESKELFFFVCFVKFQWFDRGAEQK